MCVCVCVILFISWFQGNSSCVYLLFIINLYMFFERPYMDEKLMLDRFGKYRLIEITTTTTTY